MSDTATSLMFGVPAVHDETGDIQVAEFANLLEISQAQLARTLGISRQLVNQSPRSAKVQRELRRLEYLFARVRNLTGSPNNARTWLKMGHPDFEGVAPIDLLEQGHIEAVEAFLLAIETGSPR
jgi:transcriptional regulator with XRE-family HTH domain